MECWGMVDDTYFYVIKSRFEKICVEAGYSAKSLLSWMKQTGKIEVSKGYTKTKRINGEAVSCVWIIKDPNGQMQLEDVPGFYQKFLTASVERMAFGANFDSDFIFCGACYKFIAAVASYCHLFVLGMDSFSHFFHLILSFVDQ